MTRRAFVVLALAAGASWGHSPYRQWQVYRQRHLVVVTSREDPEAFSLAESVAAFLAARLPDSRATAARARDALEVVRLLASRQLEVALLGVQELRQARSGGGGFAAEDIQLLRGLATVGSYVLVCREDFPDERAYRLAEVLASGTGSLGVGAAAAGGLEARLAVDPGPSAPLPIHPGARDYYRSRPAVR
jgi:hypothetical protein